MFSIKEMKNDHFGTPCCICSFICDTEDDVALLPTSTTEGTGGESPFDNRKCTPGSDAYILASDATHKVYMLNHQNQWVGQ